MLDISNIELRHLRYFVAVADELHFGRAAERLNMAQPPLSQAIRQLESRLGVALFERTRRRVSLTDAGRVFREEAIRTLRCAEQAVRAARQAGRGDAGRLEVGFVASAPFHVLPQLLRAFREAYPLVTLTLRESTTADQVEALREGRIDVGFVRPPVDDARLELHTVLREPLVVALPEGHPLARRRRVPLASLAREPFITFPRPVGPGLHEQIRAVCGQAGFIPQVTQEAGEMQTIVGLVGAGLGVSLVPESVGRIQGTGAVYRPLQPTGALVELAVAARAGESSPLVRNFLDLVRREARELLRGRVV